MTGTPPLIAFLLSYTAFSLQGTHISRGTHCECTDLTNIMSAPSATHDVSVAPANKQLVSRNYGPPGI